MRNEINTRRETHTPRFSPSESWIDGYSDANSDRAPQDSSPDYMAGYELGAADLEEYGSTY